MFYLACQVQGELLCLIYDGPDGIFMASMIPLKLFHQAENIGEKILLSGLRISTSNNNSSTESILWSISNNLLYLQYVHVCLPI